ADNQHGNKEGKVEVKLQLGGIIEPEFVHPDQQRIDQDRQQSKDQVGDKKQGDICQNILVGIGRRRHHDNFVVPLQAKMMISIRSDPRCKKCRLSIQYFKILTPIVKSTRAELQLIASENGIVKLLDVLCFRIFVVQQQSGKDAPRLDSPLDQFDDHSAYIILIVV